MRRTSLSPLNKSIKPLRTIKKNLRPHNLTNKLGKLQGSSMNIKITLTSNMIDNITPSDFLNLMPQPITHTKVAHPDGPYIPMSNQVTLQTLHLNRLVTLKLQ